MNTILSQSAQRAQRSGVHESGGTPLLAHLPTRKLGKHGGVGLAGDQGVEHVAPGLAHHVGRDTVELDPCVFERLVQAIAERAAARRTDAWITTAGDSVAAPDGAGP
jgi:hypothetical protein